MADADWIVLPQNVSAGGRGREAEEREEIWDHSGAWSAGEPIDAYQFYGQLSITGQRIADLSFLFVQKLSVRGDTHTHTHMHTHTHRLLCALRP